MKIHVLLTPFIGFIHLKVFRCIIYLVSIYYRALAHQYFLFCKICSILCLLVCSSAEVKAK